VRFDDSPASREVQSTLADFMTYGTRVVIPGVYVDGLVVDAPAGIAKAAREAGYRLGSDRGSPNHGSTLASKRVMAQI
jgi:hypothetical protein